MDKAMPTEINSTTEGRYDIKDTKQKMKQMIQFSYITGTYLATTT